MQPEQQSETVAVRDSNEQLSRGVGKSSNRNTSVLKLVGNRGDGDPGRHGAVSCSMAGWGDAMGKRGDANESMEVAILEWAEYGGYQVHREMAKLSTGGG